MADSIDPALWDDPDMRAALARHDIGEVYQLLKDAGLTQKAIAELTGQGQSEVGEILRGRPVQSYDVLVRIADSLGVPRGWMGLAYSDGPIFSETGPAPGSRWEEVPEEMRRRKLLAAVSGIMFERAVLGPSVGAHWLATAAESPMPVNVGLADVKALRALTGELRALARGGHPGMPEVWYPVVQHTERLLDADNVSTPQQLMSVLARMHTEAGWCAYDMHLHDLAAWHYSRAIQHAAGADDVMALVSAVQHQAVAYRELGEANASLKLVQMGLVRLEAMPFAVPGTDAERARDAELGGLHLRVALALADLGHDGQCTIECAGGGQSLSHQHACSLRRDSMEALIRDQMGRAGQYSDPADSHNAAYLEYGRSGVHLSLGRLDAAQRHARAALSLWNPNDNRRDWALARIRLATIHTVAGEPDGSHLASAALDVAEDLRSARGRAMLAPLGQALEARRDSTSMDLAQRVRVLRQGSTKIG